MNDVSLWNAFSGMCQGAWIALTQEGGFFAFFVLGLFWLLTLKEKCKERRDIERRIPQLKD